jgi:hypothetical protein
VTEAAKGPAALHLYSKKQCNSARCNGGTLWDPTISKTARTLSRRARGVRRLSSRFGKPLPGKDLIGGDTSPDASEAAAMIGPGK